MCHMARLTCRCDYDFSNFSAQIPSQKWLYHPAAGNHDFPDTVTIVVQVLIDLASSIGLQIYQYGIVKTAAYGV